MTDLTHLIGRLRELADWPHDVAGAQDDIRQAADALQSLTARVAGMEKALEEAQSHFESISARVDRENRMIDDEHIDPAWGAVGSLAWDGLQITKTALAVKP